MLIAVVIYKHIVGGREAYSTFTLRSQFIRNSSVEIAVCDVLNVVPKQREKPHITRNRMRTGVVIKRARESERRPFFSKVTSMAKGQRLCSRARAVTNRVVDYSARLKMRNRGRGPLKRTSEPTGK